MFPVRGSTNEIANREEFEIGYLDIIDISDYKKILEYRENPNFLVQEEIGYAFGFFGFNMRENREILGSREPCPIDPEMTIGLAVRKAISYATDKKEINDVVHAGEFVINHWPLYPKMGIWCNPDIIRYDYDLYKAKELMIKAGFIIENFTPTINGFTTAIVMSSLLILSTLTYFLRRKKSLIN